MIIYSDTYNGVKATVYTRRGNKRAFFPWQREEHVVGQISIDGVDSEVLRFAILDPIILDQFFDAYLKISDSLN